MPRRRHIEEHENHERWLVSYADFITLLFAFFVVMYAMSSVNEGKMRVLSDSLIATFSSRQKSLNPIQVGKLVRSRYTDDLSPITKPLMPPPAINALIESTEDPAVADAQPAEESGQRSEASKDGEGAEQDAGGFNGQDSDTMAGVDEVADRVESNLESLIDDGLVNVRRKDNWLEIEFKSSVLFDSGNARLSGVATGVLDELAGLLKEFPNPIQVEGFTDNVPISTVAFPSNWELSAARAASVVSLFAGYGVNPERMAAIGYGEYRPIAENDTPDGRARNRRVVLVIPAKGGDKHLVELNRLAGESSAGGVNTVQPWAEAPAEYDYTRE